MKKAFNIAWKDLLSAGRDPASLLLLLLTPFGLTLVIGFAFGGFGGGSANAGLADIPVTIINLDRGQFGANLVQVFESQDLADLLEPVVFTSTASGVVLDDARTAVDEDRSSAVVIIPEGFSDSLRPLRFPEGSFEQSREPSVVEIYGNPTRPVSVNVVRSIIDQFLNRMNSRAVAARVSFEQLLQHQIVSTTELESLARSQGQETAPQLQENPLIEINRQGVSQQAGENVGFNWLAYIGPSMAILFLMFSVSAGGRNILAERDEGTLARMLVSPSSPFQILMGKILGIFFTGLAQLSILILASTILLQLHWGDPLALATLVIAVVAAATSWGTLLAAYARTPGQANAVGTSLALVFGAGAGNFVPRPAMPEWLQIASYVSPNAWGLEGFMKLTGGGSLNDIGTIVLALLVMTGVVFGVALLAFRHQYR